MRSLLLSAGGGTRCTIASRMSSMPMPCAQHALSCACQDKLHAIPAQKQTGEIGYTRPSALTCYCPAPYTSMSVCHHHHEASPDLLLLLPLLMKAVQLCQVTECASEKVLSPRTVQQLDRSSVPPWQKPEERCWCPGPPPPQSPASLSLAQPLSTGTAHAPHHCSSSVRAPAKRFILPLSK